MQDQYTYNALIQFLYHELPAAEAIEMAAALEDMPELRAEYELLRSIKTQLPKAQFHPAPAVISNILQYSTKTTLTNEGVL
jgi:anti-sigma factor RsiW